MKNRIAKRAFTLIELLVVIAIIAILAAILFPVFAQAKAAAKKTVDLSNLKQAGTASAMYQNDNDDIYPSSHSEGSGGSCGTLVFAAAIDPYVKSDAGKNWEKPGSVWHNPVETRISSVALGYTTNAMLAGVFGNGDGCAPVPIGQPIPGASGPAEASASSTSIQNPANVVWLVDAVPLWFSWVSPNWASIPTDLPRPTWDVPGRPAPTSQAAKDWYKDKYLPSDLTDGWTPQGNPWECPIGDGGWACKGIDYIHNRSGNKSGSTNASFSDTHAKSVRFGQLKVENLFPDL